MSLNQLMREHVSTVFLNMDHFAELITLHLDGGVKLKAIVDIPDVTDSGEGSFPVTGSISVATADLKRLRLKDGVVLEATIRNQTWHLYEQSTDEFGVTKYPIRRKHAEQKHTNLYALNGDQIQFASE